MRKPYPRIPEEGRRKLSNRRELALIVSQKGRPRQLQPRYAHKVPSSGRLCATGLECRRIGVRSWVSARHPAVAESSGTRNLTFSGDYAILGLEDNPIIRILAGNWGCW